MVAHDHGVVTLSADISISGLVLIRHEVAAGLYDERIRPIHGQKVPQNVIVDEIWGRVRIRRARAEALADYRTFFVPHSPFESGGRITSCRMQRTVWRMFSRLSAGFSIFNDRRG
jgi:hypothetical protein